MQRSSWYTHSCSASWTIVLLSGESWRKPWCCWTSEDFAVHRVIFGARKYDDVTPFLKKLNWLTVENMLSAATACFMWSVAKRYGARYSCSRIPFKKCMRSVRKLLSSQTDFHVPNGSHSTWKEVIDLQGDCAVEQPPWWRERVP